MIFLIELRVSSRARISRYRENPRRVDDRAKQAAIVADRRNVVVAGNGIESALKIINISYARRDGGLAIGQMANGGPATRDRVSAD